MSVLLIYGSRRGTTQVVAERIAGHLGVAVRVESVARLPDGIRVADHDLIVIGTADHPSGMLPETSAFIDAHGAELREAQVAVFTVALPADGADPDPAQLRRTLQPLLDRLGDAVVAARAFGLPPREADLTDEERTVLRTVHDRSGWPQSGTESRLDWARVDAFALELRRFAGTRMTTEQLHEHLATFLAGQTVATLATASPEGEPRASTVEIRPWLTATAMRLYLLTEGGRKLDHLARNPRVSVALHDPVGRGNGQDYRGLQVTGIATVIAPGDEGYAEAERVYPRKQRIAPGIYSDDWRAVSHPRRYIRVDVTQAELLDTALAHAGYRTRQTWFPAPNPAHPSPEDLP